MLRDGVGKLVLGEVTSECFRTANRRGRWCVQGIPAYWIDVFDLVKPEGHFPEQPSQQVFGP